MIASMSKVEIVGPKGQLQDVIFLLQKLNVLQIEPETAEPGEGDEADVAALLHILNIILGVFSPAIHSLRLHYVEFFSKFVESGGKKFEPLGK